MSLFGVISGNDSEKAYNGDGSQTISTTPMRIQVIMGAGYFLKSHADFQLFLHDIEMAELTGPHYEKMQTILDSAIAHMESAAVTYRELKDLAAVTPYNPDVIDKLTAFAYPVYMKNQKLDQQVFQQVAALLSRGNVTGVYEHLATGTAEILKGLYRVKKFIDKKAFPGIPSIWQLHQLYSDSLFFGQYTAMIFSAAK